MRHAVDHAPFPLFIITPDGHFEDVNETACQRLGYSREELLCKAVADVDPNDPEDGREADWERLKG